MADHQSLTESVLQRGAALLECMASNSPGEQELLGGAACGYSWPPVSPAAGGQLAVGCENAGGCKERTDAEVYLWLEVLWLPHAFTLLRAASAAWLMDMCTIVAKKPLSEATRGVLMVHFCIPHKGLLWKPLFLYFQSYVTSCCLCNTASWFGTGGHGFAQ